MNLTFSELGAFRPAGDLWTRLNRNYSRLEEEKYWPENVYQGAKAAEKWPGDIEGRTLLSWVLLAQATGREPRYLEEFIQRWPGGINDRGYFGKIYDPAISEQQLSSHGWVLRALAEWIKWRPASPARALASPIIEKLFLPVTGAMAQYPIDPAAREEAGEYSGSHLKQLGNWILSTDVGCFAIGMAGLIDAYEALEDERLVPLIEEMLERFLEIDLLAIKAQTHATLSACRGMLKWAELQDRPDLIEQTRNRFDLYTTTAWTETYANFNWFERPQWTEPCAIVDALMVAMELWRATGQDSYLDDAQLMYFNGLGHGQRANGGFGCDNCPGADGETDLFYRTAESHWCCTMRGSEGLARLSQFQIVQSLEKTDNGAQRLHLPFGLPGTWSSPRHKLRIESAYPFAAHWQFQNQGNETIELNLYLPGWIDQDDPPTPRAQPRRQTVTIPPHDSAEIRARLKTGARDLLHSTTRFAPNLPRHTVRYQGPLLLADYSGQGDFQPIFQDYLHNHMHIETSRKKLLQ